MRGVDMHAATMLRPCCNNAAAAGACGGGSQPANNDDDGGGSRAHSQIGQASAAASIIQLQPQQLRPLLLCHAVSSPCRRRLWRSWDSKQH